MTKFRKIKCLRTYVVLPFLCAVSFAPCMAVERLPGAQSELIQKAFTEKLDLQFEKKRLSSKECEKLGQIPRVGRDTKGAEYSNHVEYDGCTYSLNFRNGGDVDIQDLTVECRFYYEVTESWRAMKRKSDTVQKHLDHSFKIPALQSKAEHSAETGPFVVVSYSLPSGYYYGNGDAEVVESRPQGLWVRVFRKDVDGSKEYVDFYDPPSLSSKAAW